MKILFYTCYFWPEEIGVAKFTSEAAFWMAARGHEVQVVCPPPNYPHRRVATGYSQYRYQSDVVRGIKIYRCPMWLSHNQSGMRRVAQYGSFGASSAGVVLAKAAIWRPDVIFTVVPPITSAPIATFAAWVAHCATWLHVQDFDIDAAFELNFFRSITLRRALTDLERIVMSNNHVVSSISAKMVGRLQAKNIKARICSFPNWVDAREIFPKQESNALRQEFGISQTNFVLSYSGNLGEKQGIEDLASVARLLMNDRRFVVVIGGDGAGRERLATLLDGLTNVRLIPLQPANRLNDMLAMADVHLLPQKSGVADLVLPSKLGGMLASGRPIIAAADAGTQLADEVKNCGIVVSPGNPGDMAAAAKRLANGADWCKHLGVLARQRAVAEWNKETILSRFENDLAQLCGSVHATAYTTPVSTP
jgi:colanic acid biosynthesis glycosyl transferase WcaI